MTTISLTIILIGMTVLISYQAFNRPDMKYKLAFHPTSINEFGEWYRFLSSGFVHGDWQHLILNMYVFYLFGDILEDIFTQMLFSPMIGRLVFLGFYLSAIIVSDIPSFIKHRHNSAYSAVGASGATSALMTAYIMFNPWGWFIFPPLPGIVFAIGYLWYSSYMSRRGNDLIAHDAHLWGAVYGIVFMVVLGLTARPELLDLFLNALLAGPRSPNF
ncbi:rhomboid family intramembrane serine protease [Phaeodactylibacter luteus]|uniref:Rhomboid family intramembrane serine protease n=1 Tax=Phaeodactylibacter luteus TaxID=1564516 RepID=A0A5C6RL68_9BACT|nr:rhomboid family intramembrane serine protease [Phaeodactylibacter luteus]TXB62695.1 rhomboid family intramembrane serine protease [Phaeodactylibacter luteus]